MKTLANLNGFGISFLSVLGFAFVSLTSQAATIIHSNDVLGELEPCGCRSNPLGGVTRKENLLKKIREKDSVLLQLDAGDLFFPSDAMPELLLKQSELQAKYLAQAMGVLKHDAMVPGEKDFALGYSVFKKIKKEASFKFLAANLKERSGRKVFESHAIFKRDLKIGVFGIVGDHLAWPAELKATSAIAAAKAEVRALKGKVDLIVALTHEGYEKDLQLAQAVPGIDVIIGGHTQTFLQKPVQVGKTWIYQSSFRNQYIGVIPLEKPLQPDHYRLIALDAGYDSPTTALHALDGLVKKFKNALAKLNSEKENAIDQANVSDELDEKAFALANPRYQTFPRCAECHLKQFDFWRKTSHVHALQGLVDKQQSMNKECLTCHSVGLGDPQGLSDITRLGEYHHLAARKDGKGGVTKQTADSDPKSDLSKSDLEDGEDIVNQVDAFSHPQMVSFLQTMENARSLKTEMKLLPTEPSMTLRRAVGALSRAWTPVQCENCHQAGGDHPFSGSYTKKVETATCLKCHTAERAPQWYTASGQPDLEKIQGKRALVTCPAGEMAPDEE